MDEMNEEEPWSAELLEAEPNEDCVIPYDVPEQEERWAAHDAEVLFDRARRPSEYEHEQGLSTGYEADPLDWELEAWGGEPNGEVLDFGEEVWNAAGEVLEFGSEPWDLVWGGLGVDD